MEHKRLRKKQTKKQKNRAWLIFTTLANEKFATSIQEGKKRQNKSELFEEIKNCEFLN